MTQYKDYPITEMWPRLAELAEQGHTWWLKWTCPGCGERVTATTPNAYSKGGYQHTEKDDGSPCGVVYTGDKFNYLLIKRMSLEDAL